MRSVNRALFARKGSANFARVEKEKLLTLLLSCNFVL